MRFQLGQSTLRMLLVVAPVMLASQGALGTTNTRGTPSVLGRWVGTWTNVDNIEKGTESLVIKTQVGSTIAGFFCWNGRLDPATCSTSPGDYEPWTGTIDPHGAIKITGKIGVYPAELSRDGVSISGTYQNQTLASHKGIWSVRRATVSRELKGAPAAQSGG